MPLQGFLELTVEGREFLVERLQFLLGRQQLLVGRLKFLVDRQGLFVDCLLLFVRGLQFADRGLKVGSGGFEFLLEFCHPPHVRRSGRSIRFALVLGLVNEADQQQLFAFVQDGSHVDTERRRTAVVARPTARDDDVRVLLNSPLDRRPELVANIGGHHGQQIECGAPGRDAQVAINRS